MWSAKFVYVLTDTMCDHRKFVMYKWIMFSARETFPSLHVRGLFCFPVDLSGEHKEEREKERKKERKNEKKERKKDRKNEKKKDRLLL